MSVIYIYVVLNILYKSYRDVSCHFVEWYDANDAEIILTFFFKVIKHCLCDNKVLLYIYI